MAEIVGGLFGVTPESLMAQREAALQEQATKYAQLSPMQAAQAGFYTAGNRLAGAAGGLMGAQDPEMAKAAGLQGLAKNFNLTTIEGINKAITDLSSAGYQKEAFALSQEAQKFRKTEADIAKANKPNAGSVSERNRSLISQAEVKLANKQELTASELANIRWLVSQETQAKIYPDKDTGELIRVEPLNLAEAAPNIAQLLGKGGAPTTPAQVAEGGVPTQAPAPTGGTQLAPGVTSIPTPSSKAREEIKNEKVQAAIEGVDQSIKLIGDIESTLSTGGLTTNPLLYGVASGIGGTDAKTIATKLKGVEAQKVIATIEEMKNQSRTGATGFGALNIAELDQLKSSFLALDPSSKSFPQDLKDWKTRLEVIKAKLQNKGSTGAGNYPPNVEAQISAVMNDPRNKGKTRDQVINSLKSKGLIQ